MEEDIINSDRVRLIANALIIHNDVNYNKLKSSEEFQELSLALTQQLTKPKKTKNQEVIDEIGDCIIRLAVLIKMYDTDLINKRVDHKIKVFVEMINSGKYPRV